MAPPRPRTRAENRAYRRASLIRAAMETVARHDIAGATVERICRQAGASRGLIAHYFNSKEDLLVAALQAEFDEALEMKQAILRDPDLPAAEKLRRIARTSFTPPTYNQTDMAAWQAFTNASRFSPAYRKPIRRVGFALRRMAEPLFAEAARDAGVTIDADGAAFGLVALIDGLWGSLATGKDDATPGSAIQTCDAYIRGCLAGGLEEPPAGTAPTGRSLR